MRSQLPRGLMLTVVLQIALLALGGMWCYDAGLNGTGPGVAAFRGMLVLMCCAAIGVIHVGMLRRNWALPLEDLGRAVERMRLSLIHI